MKLKCRNIIAIMIVSVMAISFSITAFADYLDNGAIYGNESVGWNLLAKHQHRGSKVYKYKYDSNSTKSAYGNYITQGAALWGSNISFTEKGLFESAQCTIATTNDANLDYTAAVIYSGNMAYNTHFDSITISIHTVNFNSNPTNYTDSQLNERKKRTIAHEIGHTYGLADLYEGINSLKIMYGYSSYQKGVTAEDLKGLSVVTHEHTSHRFGASYTIWSSSNHTSHCATCSGYRFYAHNMVNGLCVQCGYRQ